MTDDGCLLESSVDVNANASFVWAWRTDIRNWNDPPARFSLDGPFVSGSWGTTVFPDQQPRRWQLRDVRSPTSFVVDLPLDGALLSFEWLFTPLTPTRTKMTQRILLAGPKADAYEEGIRTGFGRQLEAGMERMRVAIEKAAASAR